MTSRQVAESIAAVILILVMALLCAPVLWCIIHAYRWALS